MMELSGMRPETRFGMPAADQILYNRHYILGYSFYFRQAKWALEIVDPDRKDTDETERLDNFREDYRVPEMFRADPEDYEGSGYDRGHLVASANKRESELQNSETFLLSNMSPQVPKFNRGIWKKLEEEIRRLDGKPSIFVTYVICGPIFYFDKPVESIGENDGNRVSIPIPNAYFKSVLTENRGGKLEMWSFILPNESSDKALSTFQVPTEKVERYAGIKLWERLEGAAITRKKQAIKIIW